MAVAYRVHEGAVQSYMNPGDAVDELVWGITRTARDLAKLYAPSRTGRLKNSIRASRPKRVGAYENSASVSASIGYAIYVHEGTSRIYPKNGKYLTVPTRDGRGVLSGAQIRGAGNRNRRPGDSREYYLAKSVSGQRSQPFLAQGLRTAMRTSSVAQYRV
jgi:hypothetical protein